MNSKYEHLYCSPTGKHFHVLPAKKRDVPHIAANLREADRLELERAFTAAPEIVMKTSLNDSVMAWTAFKPDRTPVAMWGVCVFPKDRRVGIPWLLGTDCISESYSDFLRFSQTFDRIMSQYFLILCNMVDCEYAGAQRWLEWLGYRKGAILKSDKGFDFVVMYKDVAHVC